MRSETTPCAARTGVSDHAGLDPGASLRRDPESAPERSQRTHAGSTGRTVRHPIPNGVPHPPPRRSVGDVRRRRRAARGARRARTLAHTTAGGLPHAATALRTTDTATHSGSGASTRSSAQAMRRSLWRTCTTARAALSQRLTPPITHLDHPWSAAGVSRSRSSDERSGSMSVADHESNGAPHDDHTHHPNATRSQ